MTNNKYIDVTYNESRLPLTNYPQKLTRFLFKKFALHKGSKILDVGCGRGEFLQGFIDCGLDGYGVDQSSIALKYFPDIKFSLTDIENEGIPYPDNYFDIVYSKSVIEHFHYPEKFVKEVYRVLKNGGLVITLCPSWEYNYQMYFEDYTHRTPFMLGSLRDILLIHGFEDVEVQFFRQLPIVWSGGGMLLPLAEVTRLIAPNWLKSRSKWVRFSKEIMLLSSGRKPKI